MNRKSLWKWCSALIALAFGIFTYLSVGSTATAQAPITSGFNYSQDFNIGTSATATVPANWRVDKQDTNARAVGTWTAAVSATEFRAGNSMSSSATNGIYNYAAGDLATATDRALGWVSSGTGTRSGNLYLYLRNNSPTHNLGSLQVGYDIEKYRNGSNAAGFRIQLYYSYDGSTWTSAGSGFLTSFGQDADNTGFASAPGSTVAVNNTLTFVSPIPPSANLYLAWNYSVASGSTTTNAQGLGIDNVHLSNPLQPNAVTITALSAANNNSTSIPVVFLTGIALTTTGVVIFRRRSRAA